MFNVGYSCAYADGSFQDDTKSTAALRSAILRFPMVVPLLFASLGGNVPPKLLSHRRAQLEGSFTCVVSFFVPTYLLNFFAPQHPAVIPARAPLPTLRRPLFASMEGTFHPRLASEDRRSCRTLT